MTDISSPAEEEGEPILQPRDALLESGRRIIHLASLRGKFAFAKALIEDAERISLGVRVDFGFPPDEDLLSAYTETIKAVISELEQALGLCKLNLSSVCPGSE